MCVPTKSGLHDDSRIGTLLGHHAALAALAKCRECKRGDILLDKFSVEMANTAEESTSPVRLVNQCNAMTLICSSAQNVEVALMTMEINRQHLHEPESGTRATSEVFCDNSGQWVQDFQFTLYTQRITVTSFRCSLQAFETVEVA